MAVLHCQAVVVGHPEPSMDVNNVKLSQVVICFVPKKKCSVMSVSDTRLQESHS